MEDLTKEQIDELDPGIRQTVLWLRKNGYDTTDSGDGSKVATMERAMPFPNVAIRVDLDGPELVSVADDLAYALKEQGIMIEPQNEDGKPYIQASYDPVDASAMILLCNVDDDLLFAPDSSDEPAIEVAVQDEPKEQTELDRIVAHIRESCRYWASELRVHQLLPYLQVHGDPLYAALMALPDEERKACGVDEVQTKERSIRETDPAPVVRNVGRHEEETGVYCGDYDQHRETAWACDKCGEFSGNESDPCEQCDTDRPMSTIPIDGPGVDPNGWCNNCGHKIEHSWKTCALRLKDDREFQAIIARGRSAPNPAKKIAALVELSLSPPVMGMGGGSKTEEVDIDRWKQDVGKEVVRLRKAYGGGAPAVDWLFASLGQTFGV